MTKRDVVLDAVRAPLADLGFKKRKGGIFTLNVSERVLGWLGLNRATKHQAPGEIEVNPVVGVSHLQVERLLAELRGDASQGYEVATLSTPLGYLLPESRYLAWRFSDERAQSVATEMVARIKEHGVPFMKAMTPIDALCRALAPGARFAVEDSARYRRPIAWLLAGEPDRASGELESALAALGERTDLAATDFRSFADALRRRLAKSEPGDSASKL